MNEALREDLAEKSQALLNAVGETAYRQVVLVELRQDPDASPEAVSVAAQRYRSSESAAQEALSALLDAWAVVHESGEVDWEDTTEEPPAEADEPTPAWEW